MFRVSNGQKRSEPWLFDQRGPKKFCHDDVRQSKVRPSTPQKENWTWESERKKNFSPHTLRRCHSLCCQQSLIQSFSLLYYIIEITIDLALILLSSWFPTVPNIQNDDLSNVLCPLLGANRRWRRSIRRRQSLFIRTLHERFWKSLRHRDRVSSPQIYF